MYSAPAILFNRHLETIVPALLRRVELIPYERERIPTPDNDFLDLDWLKQGSQKAIIISHGLEGSSQRAYIKGMAKMFFQNGFDVIAWNYRGCSGELNKTLRFYHSGATDDLDVVVRHAMNRSYEEIDLIGFSLGGNISLKYLGERSDQIYPSVKKAAVFSVPVDLASSCATISLPSNFIYSNRFLSSLKQKIKWKASVMGEIDVKELDKISTLEEFDNRYTAPLHGFAHAQDYYKKCSSRFFLEEIRIPTLIVNALNDPFLSPDCFPTICNEWVTFEKTKRGGHVGFALFNENGVYWSELRALDFILHSK